MPPGPYASTQAENYVGVKKQVSRGTGAAPDSWGAFLPTADIAHNQQIDRLLEAGAAGQPTYAEKKSQLASGRFVLACRPIIGAKFSAYHMGVDTPGAPVSGVTPHVLTEDFVTDYLSIEQNLADALIERFVDSVIAEVTYACSVEAPVLRATFAWLCAGQPAYQAAATAESYESAEPFKMSDFVFTVDGDAAQKVRSFQIVSRFRFSIEQISKVWGEYAVKVAQETEVTIETLLISQDAEYRKVQYGAAANSAIQQIASTGSFVADANYGAAGTARQAKFEILNMDYDDAQYSALGTAEGTKIVRVANGRKVAGSPMFRQTWGNTDAAAYV